MTRTFYKTIGCNIKSTLFCIITMVSVSKNLYEAARVFFFNHSIRVTARTRTRRKQHRGTRTLCRAGDSAHSLCEKLICHLRDNWPGVTQTRASIKSLVWVGVGGDLCDCFWSPRCLRWGFIKKIKSHRTIKIGTCDGYMQNV